MDNITATELRRNFSEVLDTVEAGGRVVITKHNKAVAAFISADDLNILVMAKASQVPKALVVTETDTHVISGEVVNLTPATTP